MVRYTFVYFVKQFCKQFRLGRSNDCWEWLGRLDDDGYGLTKTGRGRNEARAHRFSMQLEIGRKLKPGECVLHTCDNRKCVNPRHLYIGTPANNTRDMLVRGRYISNFIGRMKGEKNPHCKLTWKKVRRIRKKYKTGKYSQRDLARVYGVGHDEICRIVNYKIWKEKDPEGFGIP